MRAGASRGVIPYRRETALLHDVVMPTGVVTWFDPATGEGLIRRNGREYPVDRPDIEPDARVAMARVHFDIKRQDGIKRAVNVTLRRGRRVSPHQHHFGDLVGAHHPDEKGHHPLTDDHPGIDPAYEGRPLELIREWARLVNLGDLSTARLLYAPQANLHVGAELVVGRDAIIDHLEGRYAGLHPELESLHERKGRIRTVLEAADGSQQIDFQVRHGHVVEQWM